LRDHVKHTDDSRASAHHIAHQCACDGTQHPTMTPSHATSGAAAAASRRFVLEAFHQSLALQMVLHIQTTVGIRGRDTSTLCFDTLLPLPLFLPLPPSLTLSLSPATTLRGLTRCVIDHHHCITASALWLVILDFQFIFYSSLLAPASTHLLLAEPPITVHI
jgi:hypothetical protein